MGLACETRKDKGTLMARVGPPERHSDERPTRQSAVALYIIRCPRDMGPGGGISLGICAPGGPITLVIWGLVQFVFPSGERWTLNQGMAALPVL